ncbi:nesprin-2 isoform X2 [Anoplopoma fimbria]|nr:nesprin-2 isoform X2 [Anoplopoma fimbria]
MPGFPPDPPPSECHGDAIPTTEGTQLVDVSWSQDGDLQGCGRLERRWVLWHEFMKEHAELDTWLRFAKQVVSCPNPAHVTYVTAKEEMRMFERLRCEARSRLGQLDTLTRRNRTLTRLFQGAIQARLLASARECGQRWDDVNTKLESITGRLKLFVSEWEGFEAEREALALWLADLEVRLTKVDHLTGNTCAKLKQLQTFQQSVCVNSGRVNVLLQRGEALIQRSEPVDAQRVEGGLLELLRSCSLVYSNIARTHTRLLSMRLVFEDDWILSQATDSGCPSETLLEEDGALDVANLDLPAFPNHPKDFSQLANPTLAFSSPVHLRPSTHEHLGLEWDPSVDIGGSVSHEDADSSYFSARTGLCHRDDGKRLSYLSSLGSQTDSNDITNQEADLHLEGWLDHAHPRVLSPVVTQGGGIRPNGEQGATSTPDKQDREPVCFDGCRVRAWLGVQGPTPPERTTSCSKAVQTDGQVKAEEERPCCEEAERLLSEPSVTSSSRPLSSLLSPALLCLFLAEALALLACLIWMTLEPPCHYSGRTLRGLHLALRYVNGPPPT